jgi:hypothetical protein
MTRGAVKVSSWKPHRTITSGVLVTEVDLSTVVPAPTKVVHIRTQEEFIQMYGQPSGDVALMDYALARLYFEPMHFPQRLRGEYAFKS